MPRIRAALALLVLLALAAPAAAAVPDPMTGSPEPSDECLLRAGHDQPVGLGSCTGVRPGGAVRGPEGGCTLNFVVRGRPIPPEEGAARTFIGTAGHCILGEPGERTWAADKGPVVTGSGGVEIGRVVYARLGDAADYALIEPASGIDVDATVCHFGGPRGVAGTSSDTNVLLQHSGQGTGIGLLVGGRSHLARRFDDPVQVRFDGPATFGDSGAPVLRGERAVGVLVSLGTNTGGLIRALRLGPQLSRAGSALNLRMSLVDAPT